MTRPKPLALMKLCWLLSILMVLASLLGIKIPQADTLIKLDTFD